MAIFVKICLIGDGAVGKTSLKNRFIGESFTAKYLITIGADFAVKEVKLPDCEQDYKLQIWDLAGQPRFSSVRSLYYKGSMGAILVFDVTNRSSVDNLYNWIKEFWVNSGETAVPIIILANKNDLRDQWPSAISEEEGLEFFKVLSKQTSEFGIKLYYLETSAKTGEKVELAFEKIARACMSSIEE